MPTPFSGLELLLSLAHPGPGVALNGDGSQASVVEFGVGTASGLCLDMEVPLGATKASPAAGLGTLPLQFSR